VPLFPPHGSGIAGGGAAGLQAAGGEQLSDPGASLAAALLSAVARQRGVAQRAGRAPGPGLAEVLRPDVLAPLLSDTEVRWGCSLRIVFGLY
jgi:hypothetical protein